MAAPRAGLSGGNRRGMTVTDQALISDKSIRARTADAVRAGAATMEKVADHAPAIATGLEVAKHLPGTPEIEFDQDRLEATLSAAPRHVARGLDKLADRVDGSRDRDELGQDR